MNWEPTKAFLRGKVVKPFLPFEKHPDLINDNLKNLYPGDEVYIFETTHNSRWARGHTISIPFPSDFTITSVNLDEIPRQNIDIVVFPLKYIQIVEEVALSSTNANTLLGSTTQPLVSRPWTISDTRPSDQLCKRLRQSSGFPVMLYTFRAANSGHQRRFFETQV